MLTEIVVSSIRRRMKTGKRKRRKWGQDEFTDLPVSRQRKWQMRMLKEGKCGICAKPVGPKGCSDHPGRGFPGPRRTWGVIGPCIANMLRAGMKVEEIEEAMNTTRRRIFSLASNYGISLKDHFRPCGRPRIHPKKPKAPRRKRNDLNLRIFLKESLNGNDTSPIQDPQ